MTFGQWLYRRRKDDTVVGSFVALMDARNHTLPWRAREPQPWEQAIGGLLGNTDDLQSGLAFAWRCYVQEVGGF